MRQSQDYCYSHDPQRREERRQAAIKAAKAKNAGSELVQIKQRLRELSEDVVSGKIDKGRASVAFQGFGVLTRVIELERKLKEQDELEERLAALELRSRNITDWK